jgi:NagD protein
MDKHFICDMDGVVYRGNRMIPGIQVFLERLQAHGRRVLFLTNSSSRTAEQCKAKLEDLGLSGIEAHQFFTAAMATARFLAHQTLPKTAYVIGGEGLRQELRQVGFELTDRDPAYVILGHTQEFNFSMLSTATRLIRGGSRFVATNPDPVDPVEDGVEPACGSLIAAVQTATNKMPYIIGKPNALMMRMARETMGLEAERLVMVGDRMDTDIKAGLEAGMTTVLVLSGVTAREDLSQYAYQPDYVFDDAGQIDLAQVAL